MTTKKTYERDPRLDEECLRPFELVDYNSGDIIQLRCGSRLNDVCPSCAVRYQIVQRRILDEGQPEFPEAADLATGQAQLPSAAFVTLTLQSFGRLTTGHAPKYPKHYRYGAAVTAGLVEPDLLRAFKEALKRACADWITAGFAIAFRGSREVQERGAGHYHLLVTLDPNTAEWDGKTRAPSPVELAERIASVGAGTAAVPAELRTHARSQTVADRRDQMKLPAASSSTLRIPERVRFGAQQDVQSVNLHSNPERDPHSYGRKSSYLSKALSYTVKDLGKTASDQAGRRNRAHLDRQKREAFALLSDYRVTQVVRRWIDQRIKELNDQYQETRMRLDTRPTGLVQRLSELHKVRSVIEVGVVRWNFLDAVTRNDVSTDGRPLHRFFGRTRGKVWVAVELLKQLRDLGLPPFNLNELRFLVKSLGTVLERVIRNHGHTGTAIASMNWPMTATAIREKQREYAIHQAVLAGTIVFGPQLPVDWRPLHRPRSWSVLDASLPPPR